MCLLSFFPPGVLPVTSDLHNGALVNDDGFGWAIAATDSMIIGRGLTASIVIDDFARARREHPDAPALFHCRLRSHGAVDLANVHPFAVGGDSRTVLAHNGIFPMPQAGRAEKRSDTRILAEDVIPHAHSLRRRRARLALERWMGPHNKVVILTTDRSFRDRAFVLNENQGLWDRGVWHSNDSYMWGWGTSIPSADDWWKKYDGAVVCPSCGHVSDELDIECLVCGWCYDCGQPEGGCLCFMPRVRNPL